MASTFPKVCGVDSRFRGNDRRFRGNDGGVGAGANFLEHLRQGVAQGGGAATKRVGACGAGPGPNAVRPYEVLENPC